MSGESSGVWLFDPDAMQMGDVVLERGSGVGSALVAGASNGHYSHALIWVGGGDFIEAMPDGTRSISFARVPVVDRADWRLLRPAPAQRAAGETAARVARNLAFNAYDKVGAIRSVLEPRPRPKPSHRFCSQLVAEAYEGAGVTLVETRSPGSVYPNLLLQAACLEETALPLIDAEVFAGAPYPANMLDRTHAFRGTTMAEEGEIARDIFAAVSPLIDLKRLPKPLDEQPLDVLNDILSLLPHLPPANAKQVADRLLAEMDARGYFSMLLPLMARFWFDVGPSAWWTSQAGLWRTTRDRHRTNADRCLEADKRMPHPLWGRLRAMYALNGQAFGALLEKAGLEPVS